MIRLRRFAADTHAVALIEFAYAMPILLALGFAGTEVANLGTTRMRLSQVTLTAADNASRLGMNTALNVRQLWESDINDVLSAADRQARGMGLYANGRVIISSVQKDSAGRQSIAWQRCRGQKRGVSSRFGPQGTNAGDTTSDLAGFQSSGRSIHAPNGGAVIIVEVTYDYQPVTGPFYPSAGGSQMTSEAFFTVRDNRDLSQVYRNPATPQYLCTAYSN